MENITMLLYEVQSVVTDNSHTPSGSKNNRGKTIKIVLERVLKEEAE